LGKNVLTTALVPNQANRVISLSEVCATLLNSSKVVLPVSALIFNFSAMWRQLFVIAAIWEDAAGFLQNEIHDGVVALNAE